MGAGPNKTAEKWIKNAENGIQQNWKELQGTGHKKMERTAGKWNQQNSKELLERKLNKIRQNYWELDPRKPEKKILGTGPKKKLERTSGDWVQEHWKEL